ncbi:unnamed protein product [Linum trigynum]|uniref:Retrotransposon gag domain-containing protein n=1 Tax=Linum trigynum TaxID=586398 RepID=A0AAV2CIH6_9ROSI
MLNNHPHHSITSWADLCDMFFAMYIPPSKTTLMRSEIIMFLEEEDEPLFEAWERFASLLLKCTHHDIVDSFQVESFYNGLTRESRNLIDEASGGAIKNKEVGGFQSLIEEMALNNHDWDDGRRAKNVKKGILLKIDEPSSLASHIQELSNKIDQVVSSMKGNGKQLMKCDWCGESSHTMEECKSKIEASIQFEQANFVGGKSRGNYPYSSTYNPGWRNHFNFLWSIPTDRKPPRFQSQAPMQNAYPMPSQPSYQGAYQVQGRPSNGPVSKLQDLVGQFVTNTNKKFGAIDKFMESTTTNFSNLEAGERNQQALLQNLRTQLSSWAQTLSSRPRGTLLGNTKPNLKDECHVATLRSDQPLMEVPIPTSGYRYERFKEKLCK